MHGKFATHTAVLTAKAGFVLAVLLLCTAVTGVCSQSHLLCSEGGAGAPPRAAPLAVIVAERRSHGSPLCRSPAAMGIGLRW